MTRDRWIRIKEIFQEALEKSPSERTAFLAMTCGADAELRREVDQLLADCHAAGAAFLEEPAIGDLKLPATAPDPYIGLTLRERYTVDREIGRGGFGVVYLARDLKLSARPVVIKVLLDNLQREWTTRKFHDEMKALARIDHPGVVGVLDAGEMPDGRLFLVMQYVEGGSLRKEIREGGMNLDRVGRIMMQVCSALQAAHAKRVYHRDLKPENILLQRFGDEEHVKLIDFGIASIRDAGSGEDGARTFVVGSPGYMAPEQFHGIVSAASDIYALGVITYEMVTGALPPAWATRKPRELRPTLPAAAETAMLRAMAAEPGDRHKQPMEFAKELAHALQPAKRELRLGRLVTKMCDRRSQEDEFRQFFVRNLHESPGAPQMVLTAGEEGECHESLVERLLWRVESVNRASGASGVSIRKVPWQYDGALDARMARLTTWLLEQILCSSPEALPGLAQDNDDTGRLRIALAECGRRFLVFQHDIRAGRWDRLTAPLLWGYLEMWASIPPAEDLPQVMVFVNIIYPQQSGWLKNLIESRRRNAIRAELEELRGTRCPLVFLQELHSITREDVMEWFSLYDIFDSEEERLRAAAKVFEGRSGSRPMAEVERHLHAIHRDFAAAQGHS